MLATSILSASLFAQSCPPACPANRPVDDIIAEVHKEQHPHRNKNPLPQTGCVTVWLIVPLSWCHGIGRKPTGTTESVPPAETPATNAAGSAQSTSDEASSKNSAEQCREAMTRALEAAHNVEVGDFDFSKKNYVGARSRYEEALAQKSDDAAIYVRLGRTLERLNDLPSAMESYRETEKLGTPDKWVQEAHVALLRLQKAGPNDR